MPNCRFEAMHGYKYRSPAKRDVHNYNQSCLFVVSLPLLNVHFVSHLLGFFSPIPSAVSLSYLSSVSSE